MPSFDNLLREAFHEVIFCKPRVDCPQDKKACKFWNDVFGLCSAKNPPYKTPCMEAAKTFQESFASPAPAGETRKDNE